VPSIVVLEGVELIPVLEVAPYEFAAETRSSPSGSVRDMPKEWYRYWSESLADSGITGLTPVRSGSWHVPTSEFADPALLRRVLEVIFQGEGMHPCDPDCSPLYGGLALRCQLQNVLIEPACCGNLGDAANWREAVGCRQAEWQELWIGHPWLSVQYKAPRLIISSPHEAEEDFTARWAVCPDQLQVAVVAAETELERFAGQIAGAVRSLGCEADSHLIGRSLAGLDQ
jgi:hypothetical protein